MSEIFEKIFYNFNLVESYYGRIENEHVYENDDVNN